MKSTLSKHHNTMCSFFLEEPKFVENNCNSKFQLILISSWLGPEFSQFQVNYLQNILSVALKKSELYIYLNACASIKKRLEFFLIQLVFSTRNWCSIKSPFEDYLAKEKPKFFGNLRVLVEKSKGWCPQYLCSLICASSIGIMGIKYGFTDIFQSREMGVFGSGRFARWFSSNESIVNRLGFYQELDGHNIESAVSAAFNSIGNLFVSGGDHAETNYCLGLGI